MIQSLKVEGLNEQFDYDLEFNKDLNIFTGTNGCGKTTLLKLIWYLISGNIHRISQEIPFKSVSIETDQFSLTLERFKYEPPPQHRVNGVRRSRVRARHRGPKIRIGISWKSNNKTENHELNVKGFSTKVPVINLDRQIASLGQDSLFFPTFRRIEGGFSIDSVSTENTEDAAVVRLLSSPAEMLQTAMSQFSEELSTDRHKFITSVSTKDIEELLPLKKIEIADKVNELYAELSLRIGKEVSSSDGLQPNSDHAISALEHIQDDLLETSKQRQKLENRMTVLDEYVQAFYKRQIKVAKGIQLGRKKEGNKAAIGANKLSSGEKQMLGFLCYNTFSDNTVIFIDEPELSLHQDWQDVLLPISLKQETGNQFFVATHSEWIYGQFPDKEYILNLENKNE
ncbi:MAG: AAA family ATPase [Candidatus Poribacteria bacterium]|nr:AAA family ATPase [Candidatus Poribacteria bacterium]